MPDVPDITDLHRHDRFADNGVEQCPICGRSFSPNGGYRGPFYDADGQEYDALLNTDPDEGPYYCEECWTKYDVCRKQEVNAQLDQFKTYSGPGGKRERRGQWVYYDG